MFASSDGRRRSRAFMVNCLYRGYGRFNAFGLVYLWFLLGARVIDLTWITTAGPEKGFTKK